MSEVAERPSVAVGTAARGRARWVWGQLREPYIKLFASQLLVGGVAMVANVLMVRALTPSHRGEVALLLQVVYLSTQVLLLGTERSFVAAYHDTTPAAGVRAYARLLAVPGGIGLAAAIGFAVMAPYPSAAVVALIAAYALVETCGLAIRSIAIAAGRVTDFLVLRVVEAVLLLSLLVALSVAGTARPEVWILAYLVAGIVPTGAYLVLWLRGTAGPQQDHNRLVRREGIALFPASLSNMAMLRVDRLALPVIASTSALGLYASVSTMTELLAWPVRAYADARLGRWRVAHQEGTLRSRPLVLAASLYCVVVAPIAAVGLLLLIVPVFGEAYAPARGIVVPLVAAAALYAVSRVSLGLLIAKGRGGLVSAAEIAGFGVSFVGYLLLIPPFGIAGAAYGSLIGYGACLLFALGANRMAPS
ncbi:Membrane protein involved in the export of O-antigen and teichoic acid [Paractinoplanes atraurantiacus]|uniref:Membrane protein involved in the export of O-antigen and teichoic acid n=1 Tax=Paractinoplanes atraurantiacus TaxID=1036182 RepID=A0A285J9J2_9ACTN|nr:Membrane protein involved in the export of O-antigen and teichoic acid [Actinoplanes atraurantiacus]